MAQQPRRRGQQRARPSRRSYGLRRRRRGARLRGAPRRRGRRPVRVVGPGQLERAPGIALGRGSARRAGDYEPVPRPVPVADEPRRGVGGELRSRRRGGRRRRRQPVGARRRRHAPLHRCRRRPRVCRRRHPANPGARAHRPRRRTHAWRELGRRADVPRRGHRVRGGAIGRVRWRGARRARVGERRPGHARRSRGRGRSQPPAPVPAQRVRHGALRALPRAVASPWRAVLDGDRPRAPAWRLLGPLRRCEEWHPGARHHRDRRGEHVLEEHRRPEWRHRVAEAGEPRRLRRQRKRFTVLHRPKPRGQMGRRIQEGAAPPREATQLETWKWRVARYKAVATQLGQKGRLRNLLDMNACLGGFAAALADDPVWVMNVVPAAGGGDTDVETLPAIYDRGLIGAYHDWCEPLPTPAMSYDLLHANSLFTMYRDRCDMEDILLEIDRILRPGRTVIIRDDIAILAKIKNFFTDQMRWDVQIVDGEDGSDDHEKILFAAKTCCNDEDRDQEQ